MRARALDAETFPKGEIGDAEHEKTTQEDSGYRGVAGVVHRGYSRNALQAQRGAAVEVPYTKLLTAARSTAN